MGPANASEGSGEVSERVRQQLQAAFPERSEAFTTEAVQKKYDAWLKVNKRPKPKRSRSIKDGSTREKIGVTQEQNMAAAATRVE
jgi:hypothetical protein